MINEDSKKIKHKVPEFIEFRKHVDKMIQDGELDPDMDPVLYSIHERQIREFLFRSGHDHRMGRVMTKDSGLGGNDYAFMLGNLDEYMKVKAFGHITEFAASAPVSINPLAAPFIKKIVESMLVINSEDHPHAVKAKNIEGLCRIMPELYDDLEVGSTAFNRILVKFFGENSVEKSNNYENILSSVSRASLEGNQISLDGWVEIEKIASYYGSIQFRDKAQHVSVMKSMMLADINLNNAIESGVFIMDKANTDSIANIISRRIDAQLTLFSKTLKSSPATALHGFGSKKKKNASDVFMESVRSFNQLLDRSSASDDLKRHIGTDIMLKICNGDTHVYQNQVAKDYMDSSKNIVDWDRVFEDIKPGAKKFILEHLQDRNLYIKHIKRGELAGHVRDDMGL